MNPEDLLENFRAFLALNEDWQVASNDIANDAAELEQELPPYLSDLQNCVPDEVKFSECMWRSDFERAYAHALDVLGKLTKPQLKGLRAFWSYQAGVAAFLQSQTDPSYSKLARDQFEAASKSSDIQWVSGLRASLTALPSPNENNPDEMFQARRIANKFAKLGVTNNLHFNREVEQVLEGLTDLTKFEASQVKLGELLGFISENSSENAAPDPWWAVKEKGIVFEDYAEAQPTSVLSPTKAKQALGHKNWLLQNRPELGDVDFQIVLVTPVTRIEKGAVPQVSESYIWNLSHYISWCNQALDTLRQLKGSFRSEDDLAWLANCISELRGKNLTMETLIAHVASVDCSKNMEVLG